MESCHFDVISITALGDLKQYFYQNSSRQSQVKLVENYRIQFRIQMTHFLYLKTFTII